MFLEISFGATFLILNFLRSFISIQPVPFSQMLTSYLYLPPLVATHMKLTSKSLISLTELTELLLILCNCCQESNPGLSYTKTKTTKSVYYIPTEDYKGWLITNNT
uniref:Uncharacterized protein n=1 Tax=Cacopsylla melanoneura TaxID=428564 RepID=A0A8D8Z2N0_9HEMI